MPANLAPLDFGDVFRAAPCALLVIAADAPRFTIREASDAYLAATDTMRDILGAPLFEVFPDNPDHPGATGVSSLSASILKVIESGLPDRMPLQRYDIPQRGVVRGFQERHWLPFNRPFGVKDGRASHVIHRADDVTSLVRAGHRTVTGEPPVLERHAVPIRSQLDLPRLREVVREACAACELDELAVLDVLVAASEIGRHTVADGAVGSVEVRELGLELPRGVQLAFRQQGASGLHAAFVEGSTAVALGVYGPRQLVDDFAAESDTAATTVTITKWRRRGRSASSAPPGGKGPLSL